MSRSNILLVLAAAVSTMLMSVSAGAASTDPSGWVGGLFGLSVPNYDSTTARTAYGVTAGAKIGSDFGVGGYFISSANNETIAGQSKAFNYDFYGVEGALHFEGEAKGVYLGGRLGTSKVKLGDLTTSPFHWGLVAGYNHMLTNNLSLGGEGSFMSVSESSGTVEGIAATQTIKAFTTLGFLASVKLWF
jgi:hypothetical protein